MMFLAKTLSFYKRKDIQEEIVKQAKGKEIAFRFGDFFGKRPETITYPADVLELAKQKVTSFHCSEELWKNPLQLSTGMRKKELDELRKGWDLILDIDCRFFEYSKIAAHYTIKALKHNGVESITAKFSGNKGFHIAVPFEAFPDSLQGTPIKELFPEAPKRIAEYISFLILEPLGKAIQKIEKNNFNNIVKRTGLPAERIIRYEKNEFGDKIPRLNVEPFLEIDTILITSRHLYRMPYSFHEKSQLVSVPVDINKILKFRKEQAKSEKAEVKHSFLDRRVVSQNATTLLKNAFDFKPAGRMMEEQEETRKDYDERQKAYSLPEKAIAEEKFPPCIKIILNGLEDGRKRAVFILINFLASCGWDYEMIEKRLLEWNDKNPEPLRPQYILGQLRYAKQGKDIKPPPNCNNMAYYKGFSVCKPEELCEQIKNPLQYAKRREKRAQPMKKRVRKNKNSN